MKVKASTITEKKILLWRREAILNHVYLRVEVVLMVKYVAEEMDVYFVATTTTNVEN